MSKVVLLVAARAGDVEVLHVTPMGYAQKRLATSAAKLASISPSTVRVFPPKEAIFSSSSNTPHFFDPQTWAQLQPQPQSALTAFAHRIGLGSVLTSPEAVQQACTHPSFLTLWERYNPKQPLPATNATLTSLGNSLLGLFATEHVNASYPHLPTRVLKAAVSAYVGPTTCANIAKEMGAAPLLRWHRLVRMSLLVSNVFAYECLAGQYSHPSCRSSSRCPQLRTTRANRASVPIPLSIVCSKIRAQIFLQPRG